MNINASIIDQRLVAIAENIQASAESELKIRQPEKLKSLAFVYLCVQTVLALEPDEAFDCLTEGGGDFSVDAIHISEAYDYEFIVSLFQGKYKRKLDGAANFPESDITKLIAAIKYLFDPTAQLQNVNERLLPKIEDIRALIGDGYLPRIRVFACNNGLPWTAAAQSAIDREIFGDQVTWEHVNHEYLIKLLQASTPIKATLQLSGKAIVEDMNFSRVLIGRIAVTEVAKLIEQYGERLLERNIRRFLGLKDNRVNHAIRATLLSAEQSNFYFYNNGITLICDNFSYNGLQSGDYQVRVENLQVINGGQTCMTIFETVQDLSSPNALDAINGEISAYVLLRLYQLSTENDELVQKITYATNSQNPVDLKDLRANEERQRRLELDLEQLGYRYRRKRSMTGLTSLDITSGVAAQAVLAVWRQRPHQAKFFAREHFGKLYDVIFTEDLNGAQVIVATQLYRIAENRRKRPIETDPDFVRYASFFIAMQMGCRLLQARSFRIADLNHQNFSTIHQDIEQNAQSYFEVALQDVQLALHELYGDRPLSLQQLSATFRRGDLISILQRLITRVSR